MPEGSVHCAGQLQDVLYHGASSRCHVRIDEHTTLAVARSDIVDENVQPTMCPSDGIECLVRRLRISNIEWCYRSPLTGLCDRLDCILKPVAVASIQDHVSSRAGHRPRYFQTQPSPRPRDECDLAGERKGFEI